MCQLHTSVEMAFKDWIKNRSKFNLPSLPHRHYTEIVDGLLCANPQVPCYDGKCEKCGIEKIESITLALEHDDSTEALPYSWDEFTKNEKGFPVLETMEGSPRKFLNHLIGVLRGFPYHRFLVKHQAAEITGLKENLPVDSVLLFRDFAEKLTLRPLHETQR